MRRLCQKHLLGLLKRAQARSAHMATAGSAQLSDSAARSACTLCCDAASMHGMLSQHTQARHIALRFAVCSPPATPCIPFVQKCCTGARCIGALCVTVPKGPPPPPPPPPPFPLGILATATGFLGNVLGQLFGGGGDDEEADAVKWGDWMRNVTRYEVYNITEAICDPEVDVATPAPPAAPVAPVAPGPPAPVQPPGGPGVPGTPATPTPPTEPAAPGTPPPVAPPGASGPPTPGEAPAPPAPSRRSLLQEEAPPAGDDAAPEERTCQEKASSALECSVLAGMQVEGVLDGPIPEEGDENAGAEVAEAFREYVAFCRGCSRCICGCVPASEREACLTAANPSDEDAKCELLPEKAQCDACGGGGGDATPTDG